MGWKRLTAPTTRRPALRDVITARVDRGADLRVAVVVAAAGRRGLSLFEQGSCEGGGGH